MIERMDPMTDKLKTPLRGRTMTVRDERDDQAENGSIKVVEWFGRNISGSNPRIIPHCLVHQETTSRQAFGGSSVQSGKQIP
jgi:hypothetical protein